VPTSIGITATARNLPRLISIARILARHGLFAAVRGKAHWPAPPHVREALEECGVVFLKFGQVLALRRDILPDEYVRELEKLLDRLPPMEFAEVVSRITSEQGTPLDELFASFSEQPLASATIAQVHAATLADGRSVVVKVRRPGLEAVVARDIATLGYLATAAEKLSPHLRVLDMPGMVDEFRSSLIREMDFRIEAHSIRRFRAAMAEVEGLWIPDVIPERSTQGVLTMEHSPGERIDVFAEAHPELRVALARPVAALVLRQIFREGLFHADPHPGNLFVLPDGRLCLHDFGMIGELDEPMREALAALLEATVRGDARAATDAYLDLGIVGPDMDRGVLERDLGELLRDVRQRPVAEVSVGDALQRLLRIGSRHRVRNPGSILLLTRAFLIVEGVLRRLDPGLNVVEVFGTELGAITAGRFTPAHLAERAKRAARELELLLASGPSDLRRLLRRVGDGDLGRVRAPGVESLAERLSRDVERLTGAVASAALLVAGSMIAGMGGWRGTLGTALIIAGILGSLAVGLGAWYRSRRGMRQS
jgi:ubiquinone biosynthesis protein